ncbi:uncharacterized protein LOC109791271 [Cajanus cajan]|uniref:uncharacterized protein LOC109791271 n=1 Tax=Cajanus cajan TaxID=3821 RepID=UPI00098D9327|nr:uncharacterized protein LOC109791271 [Cajanus cajan]
MAKIVCFSYAFLFILAVVSVIEVVWAGGEGSLSLEECGFACADVPNVAQRLTTRSHVCSTAASVVRHVCVSHQEPLATKMNVHAITIGKPRKEHPSALNLIKILRYRTSMLL